MANKPSAYLNCFDFWDIISLGYVIFLYDLSIQHINDLKFSAVVNPSIFLQLPSHLSSETSQILEFYHCENHPQKFIRLSKISALSPLLYPLRTFLHTLANTPQDYRNWNNHNFH